MRKSKLWRRISWRVIGIVTVIDVLIIGAILAFVFIVSLVNSDMRGQHVTDGISGKMENMLRAVEVAARNNAADLEENIDSPEHVFDALEHILQLNKNYVGCFAAFEPDYFKGQGRWFEAYAYYTDSTHTKRQQVGSPQHDYFNKTWYQKALSLGEDEAGYLTDPYYDDSAVSRYYCSYVVPIHDRQGRKVGAYGIDLQYDWIIQAIKVEERKIKKTEFLLGYDDSVDEKEIEKYFHILVLDSNGNKVAGSDSIDTALLRNEQEEAFSGSDLKDLKGTPYYINSWQLEPTDWTLAVLQHYEFAFMWGEVIGYIVLFFMGIGVLVIFFFMSRSIRSATKPLGFLSDSAQEVAKGNFDTLLPTFKHNDEIAQLRDSFGSMQTSLKQYVEELKATTASKATIESELNVAHSIQMSMLPKTFPPFPNRNEIDLYGSLNPAKAVGGDLYDFFIHDEKLFFCIGDVSGKGVPASLVMAVSRTLFRNIAMHVDRPSAIASTMNENISEGNDECMFVTFFVGVLDLATGHLSYCNAGHNSPFVGRTMLDCVANMPIGVMAGMNFTEQETVMAPGSTIFLYTDGLTEAENATREQFGEERMSSVVNAQMDADASPRTLVEAMTEAVHAFVGETEQSDDLTLLAIRYLGSEE